MENLKFAMILTIYFKDNELLNVLSWVMCKTKDPLFGHPLLSHSALKTPALTNQRKIESFFNFSQCIHKIFLKQHGGRWNVYSSSVWNVKEFKLKSTNLCTF